MEPKELWRSVLTALYPDIRHDQFITWFADTAILTYSNGLVVVGVPNSYALSWIEKHQKENLLELLKKEDPEVIALRIQVESTLTDIDDNRKVTVGSVVPQSKKARKLPNKQEVKVNEENTSIMLNNKYSLHSFIVGKHNRLVHAACSAVATNPGSQWNPLFIYGGVGLGKTHLLQGTGREMLKNFPNKTLVYFTAERFLNEVVDAIKKYNAHDFKARYRSVDCLIVDDIQLLAEKDRTQEEFFHLFNELYNANKQIIISSDRPPKELHGIEARLQSRFEMGMVAEAHFPDYETRLAILQNKCSQEGVIVAPDVLDFIAQNVHNSIRELEGVLKQAIAEMRLANSTPTVKSIAAMIYRQAPGIPELTGVTKLQAESKQSVRNADDIIQLVSDYYRMPSEQMKGSIRRREVMLPRQICMYLIYEILGCSYDTIGEYFSGRNHTTVLHSCNKVKNQLNKDSKLLQDIHALKREIGL